MDTEKKSTNIAVTIRECDIGWTQTDNDGWDGAFSTTDDLVANLLDDLRKHIEKHLLPATEGEENVEYKYEMEVSIQRCNPEATP